MATIPLSTVVLACVLSFIGGACTPFGLLIWICWPRTPAKPVQPTTAPTEGKFDA